MKNKHNKKRNTAFIFEALTREATVAIIKEDEGRKNKVVAILKKHFTSKSVLKRDLECYRSLYENQSISKEDGKRIVEVAKQSKSKLNKDELFQEQSALINDINRELGASTFSNFVPNYKTIATISMMFNSVSPKRLVMLENKIVEDMSGTLEESALQPVGPVSYEAMIGNFNQRYDSSLLKEQKELIGHYVSFFAQGSLETKVYLNDEIGRLKEGMTEVTQMEELADNEGMMNKVNTIKEKLESYKDLTSLDEESLKVLLVTQEIVKEMTE